MQTTNKTMSAKKYTAISDSFIGPLMPNQVRESEVEVKNFNYDEIDYSQLSAIQTEEELIENAKVREYVQKNADANSDGVVDKVDLSIYERFDTSPGLGSVVDLTGDGKINSDDTNLLEKYLSNAPNLSSYLSEYTLLEYEKTIEKEQYELTLSELNDKISSLDEELSKYDYNKDGVVDEKDVEAITSHLQDSNSQLNVDMSLFQISKTINQNFDVNGDGKVDTNDVDELKNRIQELSDLQSSVTLIESFIPSIESEIEKYAYYKTLVSSDFEDFTSNYSNSEYKEFCDYLIKMSDSYDLTIDTYIDDLESYVNSPEYNKEEFQKKYPGFEPIFDEGGYCQGMSFDRLAVVEYLNENYDATTGLNCFEYSLELSEYNKLYKYMSEDQRKIYHYLFSTKGKEAADKFVCSISDDIEKAAGYENAMDFINTLELDENGNLSDDAFAKVRNTVKSGSFGTLMGLEDYIVGWRDAIEDTATGESSYTESDYTKMYITALLSQLSSDGIELAAYEFGESYGKMIIPMLISEVATLGLASSFLPAMATTAIGKGISFASMVPSSYGNSLHEYQASGYDSSSARACALMVSLSDSSAEVVFGSVLGKGSGNVLIDILKEGIEEGGASSLQMGFEYAILGKEVTIEDASAEIGKSVLFGMLMSGMMSGKSTISANMYSENITIDCDSALEYIANNPTATVEDVVKNASANTDINFEIDSETGAIVQFDKVDSQMLEKINSSLDEWKSVASIESVSNAYYDTAKTEIEKYCKTNGLDVPKDLGKCIDSDNQKIYTSKLAQSIWNNSGRTLDFDKLYSEIDSYLEDGMSDFEIQEMTLLEDVDKTMDTLKNVIIYDIESGRVKDIDGYLELLTAYSDKNEWKKVFNIKENMTTADIKNTEFYKIYTEEIMSPEALNDIYSEFLGDKKNAKVYCIQQNSNFNKYTYKCDKRNGTLGRTEGYYAISESKMIEALNKATPDNQQVTTAQQVDDFMNGTLNLDVDINTLCDVLQLDKNTFADGATFVQAPATEESLRVSLVTDVGANAMYTPGYHTPYVSEMVNSQITGVKLKQTTDGVYEDTKNNIYARTINVKEE